MSILDSRFFTEFMPPLRREPSCYAHGGQISNLDWCKCEVERLRLHGVPAEIVTDNHGFIAVRRKDFSIVGGVRVSISKA